MMSNIGRKSEAVRPLDEILRLFNDYTTVANSEIEIRSFLFRPTP